MSSETHGGFRGAMGGFRGPLGFWDEWGFRDTRGFKSPFGYRSTLAFRNPQIYIQGPKRIRPGLFGASGTHRALGVYRDLLALNSKNH